MNSIIVSLNLRAKFIIGLAPFWGIFMARRKQAISRSKTKSPGRLRRITLICSFLEGLPLLGLGLIGQLLPLICKKNLMNAEWQMATSKLIILAVPGISHFRSKFFSTN